MDHGRKSGRHHQVVLAFLNRSRRETVRVQGSRRGADSIEELPLTSFSCPSCLVGACRFAPAKPQKDWKRSASMLTRRRPVQCGPSPRMRGGGGGGGGGGLALHAIGSRSARCAGP